MVIVEVFVPLERDLLGFLFVLFSARDWTDAIPKFHRQ